ncbi:MAG: LuxR C-terminal-related transcriptional regulator, partial [Raoultibacter sp.]
AQIEKDLYVAPGTIKAHISHIYRKLDVHSRDELYTLLEPSSKTTGTARPEQEHPEASL